MSDQPQAPSDPAQQPVEFAHLSRLPDLRRVVTGHDETGKAILSMDDAVKIKDVGSGPLRSGDIWTTESLPSRDNITNVNGATRIIPGLGIVLPNGIHHEAVELAPGATVPMHRTNSVDYNILISGRLVLILDDNVRTELKGAGDVVVQRGTLHGWHNPSTTEWTRWVSVIVSAEPVKINGVDLEEAWNP